MFTRWRSQPIYLKTLTRHLNLTKSQYMQNNSERFDSNLRQQACMTFYNQVNKKFWNYYLINIYFNYRWAWIRAGLKDDCLQLIMFAVQLWLRFYCDWQEFRNSIIYNPTLRSRMVLVEPDAPWTHPVTMTAIVPGLNRRVLSKVMECFKRARKPVARFDIGLKPPPVTEVYIFLGAQLYDWASRTCDSIFRFLSDNRRSQTR